MDFLLVSRCILAPSPKHDPPQMVVSFWSCGKGCAANGPSFLEGQYQARPTSPILASLKLSLAKLSHFCLVEKGNRGNFNGPVGNW